MGHEHEWAVGGRKAASPLTAEGPGDVSPRDFVPWRFLDACQLSAPRPSLLPASKNLHINGHLDRLIRRSPATPDRGVFQLLTP
jgi:hypothetical protein